MADMTLKFQRGSVIVMTTGSYSDYSMAAFLVALIDCDLPALAREFAFEERARLAKKRLGWTAVESPKDFPSWLIAKGHCVPARCSHVWKVVAYVDGDDRVLSVCPACGASNAWSIAAFAEAYDRALAQEDGRR